MKVTSVSNRSVPLPEGTPSGDFSTPKQESVLQESAFFAAQVRGMGPLRIGSAQSKLKLRQKVEANLQEVFKVPVLIDGLTDFLSDLAKEDSLCANLLGV